jgi:catechol 2,3-dioxygenase-like lactoylglutathione lyase family enzyme
MPIRRLNHAVLYVRDAERSAQFYCDVLGFRRLPQYSMPNGAFLQAENSNNDHDLALFGIGDHLGPTGAGQSTVGLYHLSWEVDTLGDLQRLGEKLRAAGVAVGGTNHGTTRALYARDPDGIEFEITWVVPAAELGPSDGPAMERLDLEADIARFGSDLLGGVGISR